MRKDKILEISIDAKGRLLVKPEKEAFSLIYRTASEIHWNADSKVLYTPKPREWSYADWYEHLIQTIEETGCVLTVSEYTKFVNVQKQIEYSIKQFHRENKFNLRKLLNSENFRLRTAMYLGSKSISELRSFFNGFSYAEYVWNIKSDSPLEGFNDWVASYYGWNESTAGWDNIILKECNMDEEKAVDEFFRLYDLFDSNL